MPIENRHLIEKVSQTQTPSYSISSTGQYRIRMNFINFQARLTPCSVSFMRKIQGVNHFPENVSSNNGQVDKLSY